MRFTVLISILCIFSCLQLQAQERCGTVQYMEKLIEEKNLKQSTRQFEEWLQRRISQQRNNKGVKAGPYKIPVVVHLIYTNQANGTFGSGNEAISDARVLSQIEVLNEDFRRLNADASSTPAEFLPVAGSLDIEFVLAKQTPEGLPTTGIIRKYGGKSSWAPFDEDLNAMSYWPSEDYLNIWVTNIGGDFLGYAQFPVSDLPGLENYQDGLAPTDGVVIDYTVFGVGSSDQQYNLGRTTTHEVGHFLGLRHIWGDTDNCSGTDYVADTPNQEDETYGTPNHPQPECGGNKMFQNYMDYTDDILMNLFTDEQVDRMTAILEATGFPRRNSLLSSHGLDDPVCGTTPPVDLAILSIQQPGPVTCNDSPELIVSVKNLSCPIITSIKFEFGTTGGTVQSSTVTGLSIQPAAEETVAIGSIDLAEGENSIAVNVILLNGENDSNSENSDTTFTIIHNNDRDILPLRENFDDGTHSWTIANPQNGIKWNIEQSTLSEEQSSLRFPSASSGQVGDESWFVSPVLDLSELQEASLFFDLYYAWVDQRNDRFRILASTDCGDSYFLPNPGFDKQGGELFALLQQYVSINSLTGFEEVRIAFVATNDLGNNITIDNIEFFVSDDSSPVDTENKLYTIYWNTSGGVDITFDLPERQPVGLSIVDMMGREMVRGVFPDILNQTIPVPTGSIATGLYVIRLQIGEKYYATKVYLSP